MGMMRFYKQFISFTGNLKVVHSQLCTVDFPLKIEHWNSFLHLAWLLCK